jgi:cobalt-zinc-cadmium efflux system protein
MAVTGIIMLLEIVGGFFTNSLALISDAGHMFTHFLALLISFLAIYFAARPSNSRKTFGYYRLEILAALFNGIFVILVSFYIMYQAYLRFVNVQPVASMEMLVIAIIGLIANLVVAFLLHDHTHHDLNVKSAFVHVIGDTVSSVGVIVAAIIIKLTGIYQIDAIASFIIALIIIFWGISLIKDAINILLETTPSHIDIKLLRKQLMDSDRRVKDVHDIHIWELTSGKYYFSAHVVLGECRLSDGNKITSSLNKFLHDSYDIEHSTLQLECSPSVKH